MNAPPPRVALLACSVFEREIVPIGEASSSLVECSFFAAEAWQSIPVEHRAEVEGERALRLIASPRQTSPRISEVDVAVLLQAKAAIGAGIHSLLENAGLLPGDLDRFTWPEASACTSMFPTRSRWDFSPNFDPSKLK